MTLHDLTALQQAAAIHAGELTAVELAEHQNLKILHFQLQNQTVGRNN